MQMKSEELSRSMAASAPVADAHVRHGRRLQAQVVERAVQLAADLVEHFLARDQVVCGHRRRQSSVELHPRYTHTHAPRDYSTAFFHWKTIPSAIFALFIYNI